MVGLVTEEAGRITAYGANPWNLEMPDIPRLAQASVDILKDQERFRAGARARAEAAFDLNDMVDKYLQALAIE